MSYYIIENNNLDTNNKDGIQIHGPHSTIKDAEIWIKKLAVNICNDADCPLHENEGDSIGNFEILQWVKTVRPIISIGIDVSLKTIKSKTKTAA